MLALIACMAVAATLWLFLTERGGQFRDRQFIASLGGEVRLWVADNPVAAPLLLIGFYIACSLLTLPVWPLQILAGYAYGLVLGIGWCVTGATCGSVTTALVARWLGEDFIHAKAGGKLSAFRRIGEAMGHNGLLVVLAARLCYAVPYGLSNYLFGLTGIRSRDVALGTMLGNIPVAAGWVAIGAEPALLTDWRFWAAVIGVNLLLLSPLALRYSYLKRKRGAAGSTDQKPGEATEARRAQRRG